MCSPSFTAITSGRDSVQQARQLQCRLVADSVEKVGVLTRFNFFNAVGAVFSFGRGGPHHPPQSEWSAL